MNIQQPIDFTIKIHNLAKILKVPQGEIRHILDYRPETMPAFIQAGKTIIFSESSVQKWIAKRGTYQQKPIERPTDRLVGLVVEKLKGYGRTVSKEMLRDCVASMHWLKFSGGLRIRFWTSFSCHIFIPQTLEAIVEDLEGVHHVN